MKSTAQLELAKQKKEAVAKEGKKKKKEAAPKAPEVKQFGELPADHRAWIEEHMEELGALPAELCPPVKHGRHSYTCIGPSGARVEVLLRDRAFYVKSVGPRGSLPAKPRVWWDRAGTAHQTWAALRGAIDWGT